MRARAGFLSCNGAGSRDPLLPGQVGVLPRGRQCLRYTMAARTGFYPQTIPDAGGRCFLHPVAIGMFQGIYRPVTRVQAMQAGAAFLTGCLTGSGRMQNPVPIYMHAGGGDDLLHVVPTSNTGACFLPCQHTGGRGLNRPFASRMVGSIDNLRITISACAGVGGLASLGTGGRNGNGLRIFMRVLRTLHRNSSQTTAHSVVCLCC